MRSLSSVQSVVTFSLALFIGCSKPDPLNRGSTVGGKVTLDGVPLAGGVVVFESADGAFNPQSVIRLDGTYVIQEPPLGPCRVLVKTSHLKSFAPPLSLRGKVPKQQYPGFVEEEVGYYSAIPAKYENPQASPLKVDVTAGNMLHDIELVGK
jgi:hypothetical protein